MTIPANTNWLSLAREAFSGSTTFFDSSIRPQVEAGLRQFQGVHPSGSKYHADSYKARSRLFRPKTRTTIRKNEAVAAEAFFSTKDVVSIEGEDDSDPRQRASAAIIQELLQYRLTKSIPWFLILCGAYQDAQTVGVVASYQYWKYDKKKKIDRPCIDLLPVENLRIDPGADWTNPIESSPYVIHMIPMYVKDVKARMRNVDPKTGAPKWKTVADEKILTAMKSYGDTTRMVRERKRTDSKEQTSAISDFAIVWVHRNFIEVDGEDYVYHTLGTEEILSDPKPIGEVYFTGKRPYVMGCCILETHKTYPSGVGEITKDIQAEINEIANQRIDNVKFALNKRYFVKRSKQVDLRSLTRNIPGSVTMVTDMEDVKVQETNDVTGSSYQEQDRLNLDFDDVSGSFSNSSVSSNRKLNETATGINALNANTNQVSGYQLRTFSETWVEPVLRQLVQLEQKYETDVVLLALAAKKIQLYQKYSIDAVTDELLEMELTVNVNVGTGATNPQDQVKNFMTGMNTLRDILADGSLERYGLKVDEVIKEIFGKLGYKDGGRFFNTEEEDPQITSMKSTIADLQQQLSQKVNPELVQAQIKKIDAEIEGLAAKTQDTFAAMVKKNAESMFSMTQVAEVATAIPGTMPVADGLLKEAGFKSMAPAPVIPAIPDGAIGIDPIKNKRTGMNFLPGAPGDTSPNTPAAPAAPETPGVGAMHGIETMKADSV